MLAELTVTCKKIAVADRQPEQQLAARHVIDDVNGFQDRAGAELTMALAGDRKGVRDAILAVNIAFGVLMILAFVTYNRLTV